MISSGAKFVRGDLHIHSYGDGGSYDVIDVLMTPENIVDKALEKNLSIISVTDHNAISNSINAVRYAQSKDLLVIPGIEISTIQGHLLVYFSTVEQLECFYGKLNFNTSKKFCNQGIHECLEIAKNYSGFSILAHIDIDAGIENTIGKFNEIFDEAFSHENIVALEIKNKDSADRFTKQDDLVERFNVLKRRNIKLKLPESTELAKIISSDAHSMNVFGRNESGSEKLTRFKVDELSFDSLRIALLSHDSRVRLEDEIPEQIPHFTKIKIQDGLLHDLEVDFSNNMNCIIGGRGTGKSTLLTALQEASNNKVDGTKVQLSNIWPSKINLTYHDEVGQKYDFVLEDGNLECFDKDGKSVVFKSPLESYSQGYAAFAAKNSDSQPQELLKFFDGFIDSSHLKDEEKAIITKLDLNYDKYIKLSSDVEQKSSVENHLRELEGKKKALTAQNVGGLVALSGGIIEEQALRTSLEQSLQKLSIKYKEVLSDTDDIDALLAIDKTKVIVGKNHIDSVINIVSDFNDIVKQHQDSLNKALEAKLILLRHEIREWRKEEATSKAEIVKIKNELDTKNIPYDTFKISQLSKDIVKYTNMLVKIKSSEKDLVLLRKERLALYKDRKKTRSEIFKSRMAFCSRINRDLVDSVDGLFVTAKVKEGILSNEFSSFLKKEMNWHRWSNSEKISESISPFGFYEKLKKGKTDFLDDLNFNQNEIDDIKNHFSSRINIEKLLSIPFEDYPTLIVARYNHSTRSSTNKSINELSLGQQQSILLSILIQSDSTHPLLIDQPEDNLDSEFIFNSVVKNLRKCKERRQVIVVTHNSNIGVLGDAELILPLLVTNDRADIVDRGSVDNSLTQAKCCQILEGGKHAFRTRQVIYGI